MKYLISLLTLAVTLAGCSSEGDSGDVSTANRAAASVPKTPDQLPASMPPEAKASAASAMAQAAQMQQQANDPGRARAMEEMKKQGH